MTKTDFTLRKVFYSRNFLLIVLSVMFYASNLSAQDCPSMACNDALQISVDINCEIEFTADMLLEGDETTQGGPFTLTIAKLGINNVSLPYTYVFSTIEMGEYGYTLTNSCVGSNNSCWGMTLTIEDNIAPSVLIEHCPDGALIDTCHIICAEEAWLLNDTIFTSGKGWNPVFTDNCNDLGDISFTDEVVEITCSEREIIRTWTTVTESHGHPIRKELFKQKFVLDPIDVMADVFCPTYKIQVPCEKTASPDSIAAFFDDPTTVFNEGIIAAFPYVIGADGKPSRVDRMTCNVMGTYTDQIIKKCYSDTEGPRSILRKWTILDWCTSTIKECQQIIDLMDLDGPTIDLKGPLRVSTNPWFCGANVQVPDPEHLIGACGVKATYSVEIIGHPGLEVINNHPDEGYTILDVPKGMYQIKYTATDNCGSSSMDTLDLTVLDATPPIAVAKEFIVVSLTSGPSTNNGIAKIFANSIDNGSYDACSPTLKYELRREVDNCDIDGNTSYIQRIVQIPDTLDPHNNPVFDTLIDLDQGKYVKFCCADLTEVSETGVAYGEYKVWMRVWDDGNMDGIWGNEGDNFNETWSWVRVEDKLGSRIQCPPDVVIDCHDHAEDLYLTGEATASSNCGLKSVGYYDNNDLLSSCGMGPIKRTWFIDMNDDGKPDVKSQTCVQTIMVRPTAPFVGDSIIWPPHDTISCRYAADIGVPTWNDSLYCSLLGYSLEVDTFQFEEGACYKILKHWTVIDWCQYEPNTSVSTGLWTYTQVIKVIDNDAPIFTECPDKMVRATNSDCSATNVVVGLTAEDSGDCPSPWLKWELCLDLDYDWKCDYIYTSSNPSSPAFYVAPTSSGEKVKIALVDRYGNSLYIPEGQHRLDFRVSDGCGNYKSCRTTLAIVDQKAPTPYCISNLSTAVMDQVGSVEIWASDFDRGSFDNCPDQDLEFSFVGNKIKSNVSITCLGGGGDYELVDGVSRIIELDMWVFDKGSDVNCDGEITFDERNGDYCSVELLVEDHIGICPDQDGGSALIAGDVQNTAGVKIPNATVKATARVPEYPVVSQTKENGSYAFANNPMHIDYDVSVTKEDDYLNGVSTLDIVLIQRHILGLAEFTTAYDVIAADVNNDQRVSSSDIIEMRKLILGINAEFAKNTSWRFIDKAQTFKNSLKPWPFTEVITINALNHNMTDQNFVGIKIGDVNGNAKANNANDLEGRTNAFTMLSIDAQEVVEGETVIVPFYSNLKDIIAYQFTMKHDGLILHSVKSSTTKMDVSNYATFDNEMTMSWSSMYGVSSTEALFYMEFTATESGNLSNMLNISSDRTKAEIYIDSNLETQNLGIEFRNGESLVKSIDLRQNQPNPFTKETAITFYLPESQKGILSIRDVTGKLIKEYTETFKKGENQITLNRAELGLTGVLYYQLTVGEFTSTKKMIAVQ